VCAYRKKNFDLSLRNLTLLLSQLCYSGTNCFLALDSLAEMESNYVEVNPLSGGYSSISNFIVNRVLGNEGQSVAMQEDCSVTACLMFWIG